MMTNYPDFKVVLITGALSDIGRATATAFAGAGYGVILNHRRQEEQAQVFVNSLLHEYHTPKAQAIRADVRKRDEVTAMFNQACQVFGKVDVLINNAGINRDKPFLDMSDEDWNVVLDTILKGTFMCSQEYARRYQGSEGNILNIGAITAVKGRSNGVNYCSARAGVLALTKCMAIELAPRIRVNTVTPGRIDTEELRERYQLDDVQKRSKSEQEVPMKRLGTPADVASMILYLVSSGPYITGQNFFVDGGLFMR
jgi:3-oxoacyl-[acyl-carrier protein] reductase